MGVVRAIRDQLRRWRYGATPRYSVADLPDNTFGQVTGIVEGASGALLTAPLSSRPCVFYSIIVDVYFSYESRDVLEEHVGTPFVLRDGPHRAVIDPVHAKVALRYDHTTESRGVADAHPHHRALLERHGIDPRRWGPSTLRYSEAILQVGQHVSVIGSGLHESDPRAGEARIYRDRGPTRLRMVGSPSAPLLISDRRR